MRLVYLHNLISFSPWFIHSCHARGGGLSIYFLKKHKFLNFLKVKIKIFETKYIKNCPKYINDDSNLSPVTYWTKHFDPQRFLGPLFTFPLHPKPNLNYRQKNHSCQINGTTILRLVYHTQRQRQRGRHYQKQPLSPSLPPSLSSNA